MSNQEYSSSSYLPDSRYQADSSASNPFPIKSVLKRSKSFGTETQDSNSSRITTPECFNYEHFNNNDNNNTQQILENVRSIYYQILESQESTQKIANICSKIVKNSNENLCYFLDSLLCCAKEWILEKNRLKNDKWTRFVHFLSHLYQELSTEKMSEESSKSSSSGSDNEELIEIFQNSINFNNDDSRLNRNLSEIMFDNEDRNRQMKILSGILLDCVQLSIKIPGNEQELGARVLRYFGDSLEKCNPTKMKQTLNQIRNHLLESRNDQKLLLEIVELSSSQDWQFDSKQEIYYFPFTKF